MRLLTCLAVLLLAESALAHDRKELEDTKKALRNTLGGKAKVELKGNSLKLDIPKKDWDKLSQTERDRLARRLQRIWKGSRRKVILPRYMRGPTQERPALPKGEMLGLRDSPASLRFFEASPLAKKVYSGPLLARAQLPKGFRSISGSPPELRKTPDYRIKSRVDRYMERLDQYARKAGVDPTLAKGIMYAEMGHSGVPELCNSKGACGLMQVKQGTMRDMVRLGYLPKPVGIRTVDGNLQAGVAYLEYLQDRFHGNQTLMAAAYNAGPNRSSLEHGHVPRIPETQKYVAKVSYWMKANYGESLRID